MAWKACRKCGFWRDTEEPHDCTEECDPMRTYHVDWIDTEGSIHYANFDAVDAKSAVTVARATAQNLRNVVHMTVTDSSDVELWDGAP